MTLLKLGLNAGSRFQFALLTCCLIVAPASLCLSDEPMKESAFGKSLVAGKFILPAKDGWWNWGMAPIYDEQGRLHIFNSSIPYKGENGMGYWRSKSIINHYVADSIEGPYKLIGTPFSSDQRTYHNPQISKVGDTYVLVFLWKSVERGSLQSIGMATAESLDGPWTENPNNPIIKPTAGTPNAAHASNPTFLVDRDGKFRIYYKSMSKGSAFREISVAIADQLEGPYVDHPENPLISYKELKRDIEDPYAFFYQDTYYMILEDRTDVAGALSGSPSPNSSPGGNRPGLLFKSKDGIHWDRPELSYNTDAKYFGKKLSRSERPHILWKDGKPEYLFLANHGSHEAGYYLKIEGWEPE
ncbi:Glycosyl hydrolases family 43 [Novipirellula aureliae]|uniref:Glycosyl hydrolases family 43 n=1 Tax=Novipirellula aureliae TaxID=2527966 RepID=A0A5C6DJ03_9BACT|nr:glycoside hydrolase family protein [Novipirellula aureliae]TWU36562.1 Glycosyl hydrolases family 43 [Novipirellula aureliae]